MDISQLKIKRVNVDTATGLIVPKKIVSPLPLDLPKKEATGIRITRVTLDEPKRKFRKDLTRNGHWMFDKPLCDKNQFGFIYLIHDTTNDRMYIGKKQYFGTGKANKGDTTNWKSYTSSCTALQDAIKANTKESFKFYVLEEYAIRGSLGFAETWSLMAVEAPANRDKWYNMLVGKISWTVKESITAKHKHRLNKIINGNSSELECWNE
jgi:hypothetical protein